MEDNKDITTKNKTSDTEDLPPRTRLFNITNDKYLNDELKNIKEVALKAIERDGRNI